MDKKKKEQDKTIKNIFFVLAIILIGFFIVFFLVNSLKYYDYKGVKFEKVKDGYLIFYKTTFHLYLNGEKIADYNFYIRTSPKELENVSFNGNLTIKKFVAFNPSEGLECNGDGAIAIGNIVQNLYDYLNVTSIMDKNATCDKLGRYSLINIKIANVTEVNQIGNSCYNINIANCEILKGTERYMIEAFAEIKKKLAEKN